MIIGLGSDLCNIERIQNSLDRFGTRFEQRVFTATEQAKAARRPFTKAGTLAKRFAAKEAFSKAVGTGFKRGVFMKDIGVVNAPSGAPTLALTGGAAARLADLTPAGHSVRIHLTLTDDHPWAQAFVILEAIPLSPMSDTISELRESPWKILRDLIVILALVVGIHTIIAKPFYIPSESMMPILRNGDRLVVSKWPYGWSYASVSFHLAPRMQGRIWGKLPARGDIVVLEHPEQRVDYIKRVIGLPGDTIEMRRGDLILNGKAVKREIQPLLPIPVDANLPGGDSAFGSRIRVDEAGRRWIDVPIVRETLPNGVSYDTIDLGPDYRNDEFGPYRVPDNHLFLMGDNRDGSADSRVSIAEKGLGGAVPFDVVSGRAELVTFSTDGTAEWYNPLSWWNALRSGRAGTNLRPDRGAGIK